MTCLMRLGTHVKGSIQATSCLATPRLPEEYYKDWTRHRPFEHTSPCSGGQFGQAKFALSWTASPPDKATSVDQKKGHWQLFLVWRLTLLSGPRWTGGTRSTYNTPPEPGCIVKQSLHFTSTAQTKAGWYSRRKVVPSRKVKPFRFCRTTALGSVKSPLFIPFFNQSD